MEKIEDPICNCGYQGPTRHFPDCDLCWLKANLKHAQNKVWPKAAGMIRDMIRDEKKRREATIH